MKRDEAALPGTAGIARTHRDEADGCRGEALRAILDAAADGLLVVDANGRVVTSNRRFQELWRLPDELVAVGRDEQLLGHVLDQLCDPEGFLREVQRLYHSGEEVHDTVEFKDGRVFERLSRSLEWSGRPARVWSFRDVTRERTAQRALEQERARLRGVLETIPDLVWLKDPDGVYLGCNPVFEQLYGAREEDIVGKTDYDFVDAELAGFFREKDREAAAGRGPRSNDEWLTFAADGRRGLFETLKTPMFDAEGTLIGVLGIARDVTEARRAQQAMRERVELQSRLETIAATAPGVMFSFRLRPDATACFPYASPAFERLFGVRPADVIENASAAWAMVCAGDRARLEESRTGSAREMSLWHEEFRVSDPAKGERWVEVRAVPEREPDGSVLWHGFLSDVTDRKRADDRLRTSEAKYRTLFESMAQGVFYQQPDGSIADANPAALELFGLTREEFLGRTSQDSAWSVIRENGAPLPAEEHPSVVALRTGEPVRNVVAGVFNPRRNGYVWLLIHAVPQWRGAQRVPFQVFVTLQDVTGRKQLEDALRQRDRYQRAVLDNFPFLVWLKDAEGRFLAVNAPFADATGRSSPEVLVGQTDADVWPLDLAERYRADDVEVLASGRPRCVEELIEKRGRRHWIETYKSPVTLDGRAVGTVGFARDVSDRRQAIDAVRQALEEKESLLREIHHRVKNNLSVVVSLIGLQAAEIRDSDTLEKLRELQERVRAMALVHESLYRSRNLARIDFGTYLATLAEQVRSAVCRTAAVRVEIEARDVMLDIEAAVPCGLIVNELLSNSFKHAFARGEAGQAEEGAQRVRVEMTSRGNVFTLVVADNGVGLPAAFDWRNAPTLGLQLVQVLARQLGAEISVGRSKGTTFTLNTQERG